MTNPTLVFTTGVPGSAWSMISNRLKRALPDFDKSDENEDRVYAMPEGHVQSCYDIVDPLWQPSTHRGAYFGPYHEYGHGFDNIESNYTKEEFLTECLKPFSKDEKNNKLVKSHWFAYNLDWIWDNFKGHTLFLIWREPAAAENWWYSMGGWDIEYPVYTWYETPERMREQIKIESDLIWNFAEKHNIEWWDFDSEGNWIHSRFPETKKIKNKAHPKFDDTIKVAYVTIT